MIETCDDRPRAVTLGADRDHDAEDIVNELRAMKIRPYVAQNLTRRRGGSAIDGRTTRTADTPRASVSASASRKASAR